MNRPHSFRFWTVCAALVLSAPASAADGAVTYLGVAGTDETPLLVAASDRGLIFFTTDYQVYRSFRHEHTAMDGVSQPWLWVVDADDDRDMDFIGAGNPSFVVTNEAAPLWGVTGGCDQTFVGNYADTDALEVVCRKGGTVTIRTWDGQMYLEWEGSERTLGACYADDFDGDGFDELQCALTSGNHINFDLAYAEPEEVEAPAGEAESRGVDLTALAAAVSGSGVDIGGQSLTLAYEPGSIRLGETTIAIASAAIHSAFVTDFNGDGTSELIVGGVDEVYVISPTGELLHTLNANPDAMTREPNVTIRMATANGLENSERDAIRAVFESNLAPITTCYANRMGSDQYTRTGEMLTELAVDGSGSVTRVTARHSTLSNESLEGCIRGALESYTFSPATEGSGLVQVMVDLSFVDR
jgi:hypothetical protein